jgi:colicin import membrane protein
MKKLLIAMLTLLPMMAVTAQDNTWEQAEKQEVKGNPDQKYLTGAVPEVNGKVVFETTIKAPGKTKAQIYDIVAQQLKKMTQEANQLEQSRIVAEDPEQKGQIVASYQEWLVFKNKPLVLDRTRLFYNLIAVVNDGELNLKMTRIYYLYEEEREPTTYQAEEWITDRYGLNKKQTKLARVSGKFRRKTIDRKDYIFNKFSELLNK